VIRRLQAEHTVYAPTLTGLGERSHLFSPAVDMDTHIADVVNLIRWENLTDVVLCGHSYGGLVVTAAADALPDRVSHIVYLDAFVPADGDSALGIAGSSGPDVPPMPPPPASFFGLSGADAEWVDARMTPQPLAASVQAVRLKHQNQLTGGRTYVLATGWESLDHFRANYERARLEAGWTAIVMDGSHDLMIDRPEEVAEMLRAASRGLHTEQ
jgi:pimeloyl-ACP methyl ester carboxylesterase